MGTIDSNTGSTLCLHLGHCNGLHNVKVAIHRLVKRLETQSFNSNRYELINNSSLIALWKVLTACYFHSPVKHQVTDLVRMTLNRVAL